MPFAVDPNQTAHLAELRESASAGAQALVVITFEQQALSIVREALEAGIYSQFTFGDAAKRRSLVTEIGGERLGGMYGTAGAPAPHNDATAAWEASFEAEYGSLPQSTYVKETYDATIALALAAQAAGRLDGAAIRDQLTGHRQSARGDGHRGLPRESPTAFACSPMAVR